MTRAQRLDRDLGRLMHATDRLTEKQARAVQRRLPDLLDRAQHSLGLATDTARFKATEALPHLIFVRDAIELALALAYPARKARRAS